MTKNITAEELALLIVMDAEGGFTTGRIADLAWSRPRSNMSANKRTADARRVLLCLRDKGLVRLLDALKPVCWVLTPEGVEIVDEKP